MKTASVARHHVNVTMARAKMSGTYPNSVLATLEATQHGYDEGLLLDVDGFVAEGAGENIFIVKDGVIYEPELTSALTGITRTSVIELAEGLGYKVKAKRLTRDDIYIADECFFTGTAAEVTPIRELDQRQIGAGKAGPVTKALQKAFFDVVTGKDRKHKHWLTPVPMKQGIEGKTRVSASDARSDSARQVELTDKDLPLHCPMPGSPLWARHPRVFLDVVKHGRGAVPLLRHEVPVQRPEKP